MKALIYDTETTGLPLFNEPSEDPRQPHIVQLGAILVDLETGREHATVDLITKPDGWSISDEVAKTHGITNEHAWFVGVPQHIAVRILIELWLQADLRIGHNEQFDARMVRIALHRWPNICDHNVWKKGRAECTQLLSTPILKLPPTQKMLDAGRRHHKSANLREAYLHFMGRELVDAHSAISDARGCLAVYQAIRARKAA